MRDICKQCDDRGAGMLHYQTGGHPFDIWLCTCGAGQILRREIDGAPAVLETRFGVSLDRIWPIEDLRDKNGDVVSAARRVDNDLLANAGKVSERAGLSGKVVR